MPTQFKINITKEIIARCKNCGTGKTQLIEENCAIAIALSDIFPNVYVSGCEIFPLGIKGRQPLRIELPAIAQQFVKLFDGFKLTPKLRLLLPDFEFKISIPDELIDRINIDEVKELIAGRKNVAVAC